MKRFKNSLKPAFFAATFLICLTVSGCSFLNQTPQTNQKQVTILGVIVGEEQEKLEKALAPFTEKTGIEVVYEGTNTFATTLPIRVDSGNPPDIALFPQPVLMADFAKEGQLIPLTEFITPENL